MTQKITIYHNPRCSKSRATVEWLTLQGLDIEVVEYLKNPPDKKVLQSLLSQLGMRADEVMRKSETIYRELGLNNGEHTEDQLLDAIAKYPILLERPIVSTGTEAAIGRPLENVIELFDDL